MRIATLIFCVCVVLAPACKSEHAVEPSEAHRLIEEEEGVLLDVRTPREFAQGHIEGARHIPISELPSRLGELPRDKPIVVYCKSGGRSAKAAALLSEKGFDQVHDLGAMSDW